MTMLKTRMFRLGRILGLHVPFDEARLARRFGDLRQARTAPALCAPVFRR